MAVAAALLKHARARGESQLGALRDAFDGSGQAALHTAATCVGTKGTALVQLLLSFSARVNTPDADTANTPLHRAASAGCDDALAALLGAGADCNAKDSQGGTPLLAAAAAGSAKCVAALLAAGSNPRAVSRASGATPLHAAARAASCACITALLAAGGDPTARDAAGRAPVDVAGSEDAAALLRRAAATQAAAGNGGSASPAPGSGARSGASSGHASSSTATDVKAAAKAKAAAVVAASAAKAAAKMAAAAAAQPPRSAVASPAALSPSQPSSRAATPQSPHRGAPQRAPGPAPVAAGSRGSIAGSPRHGAPSAPVIPDSPLARASGLVRADGDAPDGTDGEGQAQAAVTSATATASHCDAAAAAAAERATAASLKAQALLSEHAALRDAADTANQRAAAAALEAKQAVKAAADLKAQADAAAAAATRAEEESLDAKRAAERAHRAKRRAEQELATLAQQREAAARARQHAAEEKAQQLEQRQQAAKAAAAAAEALASAPASADDLLPAHPLTDVDGATSDEDEDEEGTAELARLEAAMAVEEARLQALRQEMAAKQAAQAAKRSQRSPGEALQGQYDGTTPTHGGGRTSAAAATPPVGALTSPPAPAVSAAEQAAFDVGAAQRAEGIAQAERVYQSAVEAAESLAQQCEESHELREQELQQVAHSGDAAAYQAASMLHAARMSTDAARRRQAAAAIAAAAAKLSALRREDADAAAMFAHRMGTGHTGQARQSEGQAPGSGATTPRAPVTSMSPRVLHAQLALGAPGGVTPQPVAPAPVVVTSRSGYDEHDTLSRTAEWAYAAAAVAHSPHDGGVAVVDDEREVETVEGYGNGEEPSFEEVGDHSGGVYHQQEGALPPGHQSAAVASEEEEDPWMSAEVQHRQALRQQAAAAAAAAAEAAQQVSYLAAGPGSRGDVDIDAAWDVAAQLARGDVPEERVPAALSCCIAALLGPPPASRAGAWGLHEALAQEVPRELVYLRGLTLLRPLADTVACLRSHPASADWFAAHFSGAAVEALTVGDLSCKYFVDNCLLETDSLAEADVFFDPGPRGVFQLPEDSDLVPGGPRPRLDGPRSSSSGGPNATLLLVAGDPELNALVQAAAATQPRLGAGRQDSPEGVRARLSALAQWVCVRMGGPATEDRVVKAQHHLALLASQGGPQGYVPLAKVTQGLAAPRSLLFKYLCDRLFPHHLVRCRLIRAPAALAPDGSHVWNVVTVEEPDESGGEVREVHLLVDVMRERNHGALEPRLVDERSPFAAQYKATAGFSAARYIALPGRVPPPQYAGQIVRARTLPPGTFGRAFVARCRDGTGADGAPIPPDALFAVKEFTPLLAPGTSPAGAQHAALVELSTLKACRHPHVAPVKALFVAGDVWLLVSSFELGGSWDAALKALPPSRIERHEVLMRFALETAAGMAYLHARRVAHCDLKPSNLLVTPGGGVAVTDYGLSHLLPPDAQATRAGHWSAAYMAPEARAVLQGGGGGELTPLADVWSFGVCLGTALMRGDYPAPPPTQAPYPLPALGACDSPKALMAIYRLCVQPQPQARPRFDALVAELERAAKALCAGQEG